MRAGDMDPIEARGWIAHDLSWMAYHETCAQGKRMPTPTITAEPRYTAMELAQALDEDDNEAL